LDFIFKNFGLCLDLDEFEKFWIWIKKYDSPLIFGMHANRKRVYIKNALFEVYFAWVLEINTVVSHGKV